MVAIVYCPLPGDKKSKWMCRCDCGTEVFVVSQSLTRGLTRSCGCLRSEMTRLVKTIHGHARKNHVTKEYRAWNSMLRRCFDPRIRNFANYGGRGITVCQRWRDSFECFFEDMGTSPKGMSLDRINNLGNYEPGNCRWATRIQQQNNTRYNVLIEFSGKTKTQSQWAREFGIDHKRISARIHSGWDPIRAISQPIGKP